MTNKEQIIIDGVEVQNCLFIGTNGLSNHKIPYCREFTNNCKDNPNCYFKQLARKTQELTFARNEVHSKTEYIKEQRDIIDQLKQECEELEKEADNQNKRWCKTWLKVRRQRTRYRKALEEIEQELKEDIYCESQECGCDDSEECLRCTKDLILDIISRAKDC